MMDLMKEKTYVLAERMEELPEEVLNGYIVYTTYWNQYAPGITGANRCSRAYVQEDGTPYPYAAAAYKAAKDAGIKPYSHRGDGSYWNVGAEKFTRKAITVREFLNMVCDDSEFDLLTPYEFSTFNHVR